MYFVVMYMKYLYREKCGTENQLFLWQVVVVFKITVVSKKTVYLRMQKSIFCHGRKEEN